MALKQNIIYIYFKGKHLVTSKSQYQYNHGQFLYFADLDLPQAFEVHFSNRDKGESKTQIGSNKLVEIPDEYFWNGALQIYAWIYLHNQANDGETIYEVRIPLIKRAKPTDEEPLPVQQSAIDKAIAELATAVDITNENVNKTNSDKTIVANIKDEVIILKENIDSTAVTINQKTQETINASERAETSAQNAATSERKALDYSQQAEQSAQSALESKNIANQKAEIATDAATETLGYRNESIEAKDQAVQAKKNIVDYRDETKGYRDETVSAKNDVQTLKGQIEDISNTVGENAQSASQSASSASQSASSANQSANQAEQFKNQSETNVTHYPKVVNGYWYVWDSSNNEYVNTNVDARGIKGDAGESGVYIGTEEPTDENIDVWIDSDGIVDGISDVQINGMSIVENGVANMPIANNNKLGVIMLGSGLGINGTTGAISVSAATNDIIKIGTDRYIYIDARRAYAASFYGIAKAAGDTTQSQSSNAVGVYTEEAKVAIQKMLGIYEPPYELLNNFTLEEESGFDLTADMDDTPYDLRNVFIYVFYPSNLTAVTTGYGRYRCYDSNGKNTNAETERYSTNTAAMYKYITVERKANLAFSNFTDKQTTGGSVAWRIKNMNDSGIVSGVSIDLGNIVRIACIDPEPAGTQIKIYGQRAY